ncbi:MAG: hypothetical protein RJB13_1052 [Pseudomonadota bacterium]
MISIVRYSRILALLFFVSSQTYCKKVEQIDAAASLSAGGSEIAELVSLRERIEGWASRCGFSVAKDNCSVGDAALFNGLMCLSGDELACEAVRRSQGSDGRMWRAELRVAADAVNSFSRDMALGVLAYIVETRDVGLAQRWFAWIKQNDLRLCRESTDNRCSITPPVWTLFREVWLYLGLTPEKEMSPTSSLWIDTSFVTLVQAQFAPLGFEVHLTAVSLLLKSKMGQRSDTLKSLAAALVARQPGNPFFVYLNEGPSFRAVQLTNQWCPANPPEYKSEWSFERSIEQQPWLRSMGWECVMLINLIEKDALSRNSFQ